MMQSEFEARPWPGTSSGEMLPVPALEPQPPAQTGLIIPPWPEEERRQAMQDTAPPPPVPSPAELSALALAELKRRAGDEPEPTPPGPAMKLAPLPRVEFPEPQWQLEEEERLERDRRAERQRRAALLEELLAEDTDRKGKP